MATYFELILILLEYAETKSMSNWNQTKYCLLETFAETILIDDYICLLLYHAYIIAMKNRLYTHILTISPSHGPV